MTTQELKDKAEALVSEIPFENGAEFMDLLFDAFDAAATVEERQKMYEDMLEIGIDFGPICRKKHPQ